MPDELISAHKTRSCTMSESETTNGWNWKV